MAGEFGISSDEVITILRSMDVPVRNHLSPLSDEQVARVRARWEREKRVRAEKQNAPAAPTRRRRGSATAAAEPAPVAEAAATDPTKVRRRRAAEPVEAVSELAAAADAA